MNKEEIEVKGRTFLKSTFHLRVLEKPSKKRLRSILVGLQFGILYVPLDMVMVIAVPLVAGVSIALFNAITGILLILVSSGNAIVLGFKGLLDAVDHPVDELGEIYND